MHGINWRSRNPIELSGTENSALCLADRTAQSIRRRSENTYAIDLRDATLVGRGAQRESCCSPQGVSVDQGAERFGTQSCERAQATGDSCSRMTSIVGCQRKAGGPVGDLRERMSQFEHPDKPSAHSFWTRLRVSRLLDCWRPLRRTRRPDARGASDRRAGVVMAAPGAVRLATPSPCIGRRKLPGILANSLPSATQGRGMRLPRRFTATTRLGQVAGPTTVVPRIFHGADS